ncbi:cysteine-rich KTR domain-containing protein [Phascolarctobacterium succinatutens]|uniref:cysteine-rich KTR domain-containing protein n=1 Tax=Phascolarctobacterium succinatutens TaxID=626940 RepID=UPI0023F906E1|nr:cysteine-rich KTR domain-containing protein [Phascolarctobacterium succinatutens]
METIKWVLCPTCGNKTRTMMQEDTELKNFPLYCPKCKQQTLCPVYCILFGTFCATNNQI